MEFFGFDLMNLFTVANLLAIVIGTFVGMLIGAMPGLGTMIAIILLLPATYAMDPLPAILLLLAAYQASEYGGSIASIILGIPGTPAAAATLLDGNTLAKQKSPGKALSYSLTASTIGGLFGGLMLIFLSVPLTKFALQISDPEIFLICFIGLIAVSLLSTKNKVNSMISVILGLIAGTVGLDLITGNARFTFGLPELMDGVNIIALVVGLYAIPEIFLMISSGLKKGKVQDTRRLKTGLTFKEFKGVAKPTGIGSIIGTFTGIFPGLGADAAAWFSYSAAKKASKHPKTFGTGNPEGIAAPESSNNASVGGGLVPLLSLGIPGTASAAIIMGAFIIQGIQPGPHLFMNQSDLVYGIFYGFLLTSIVMFIWGKFVTSMFAKVLIVPSSFLVPIILILSIVGIYASRQLSLDIWISLGIGIAMYFLRKLDFSMPSIILAFVLGPIMETSLRRSLVLSDGSYSIFFTRTYSIILVLIIVAVFIFSILRWLKERKEGAKEMTVSSD